MGLLYSAILLFVSYLAVLVTSSPMFAQSDATTLALEVSARASPPILPLPLQRSAASATAWLDASKPDNLSVSYIVYNVPNTSTRLLITAWDHVLPQVKMGAVILKTLNYIERRLRGHPEDRDLVLDRAMDPFWRESDPPPLIGVIFGAWSTIPTKRLTYGEVGNIALGLWKAMYLEGKFNQASFEVFNADYGPRRIGYGVLRRGHLVPSSSDS
ncbi:MAG: hypothetical protein Q9166_006462 [cf. Caloplaca sp. 2 TL-2023]